MIAHIRFACWYAHATFAQGPIIRRAGHQPWMGCRPPWLPEPWRIPGGQPIVRRLCAGVNNEPQGCGKTRCQIKQSAILMEMGGVGAILPTPPGLCLSQHEVRECDWVCG